MPKVFVTVKVQVAVAPLAPKSILTATTATTGSLGRIRETFIPVYQDLTILFLISVVLNRSLRKGSAGHDALAGSGSV